MQKLKTFEMGSSKKDMWNNKKRPKMECGHTVLKELQVEKDIGLNEILDTSTGHMACIVKDRYPHTLLHGYRQGQWPKGRLRKKWFDNIREDCEDLNPTVHQMYYLAHDRVQWRNTVRAARALEF